jgi:hypothetical protein
MSSRAQAFEPRIFTYLFFSLMAETDNDEAFDENQLYPWCLERFDGDHERTGDFIARFLSLIRLLDDQRSQPWLLKQAQRLRLHPALMEVAATLRTRNNGSFPDRPFFAEVAKVARSRYPDFSFEQPADGA